MSMFDDVLGAAQSLQPSEQLRLIDALWEKMERRAPSVKWIEEAQRRSDDYDAGQMSASTWDDVRARARKKAGLDE